MKLKKDSNQSKTGELKEEIRKLQSELEALNEEHLRLRKLINESNDSAIASHSLSFEPFAHSEEIYRQIVESANEGIWISDPDVRTIFVNQRMADMLGYTVDEMMGRIAYDFLDEEGKAIARNNREKRLRGEKGIYEQKYIRKDGSFLWAMISASPLKDKLGKVIGILGMLTDITKRKNAEEALARSEQLYREVVESANSIIIRWNNKGELLFVNTYTKDFFGYTAEELIGKDVRILVPDTDTHGVDLSRLVEDIFAFPGKFQQIENENIKKNGDRVWVNWSNRPIVENGVVQEILAIGNDVTQRKVIEREIQKRALEMEAIMECNADGIIVYDKNTRIMRSNAAVEKLLNLQEDERALTLSERFHRRYKAWSENGRQLTAEELPAYRSAVNGETIRNEVIFYHVEGVPHWFNISAAPLLISGEHIGGVVSMADITWRKELEVKLQSNEAILEAFFSSSPGILNLLDQDLRFLKSDKNTPVYFAKTQQSILGRSLTELNPTLVRWIIPIMHEVISTGKSKLNVELEAPVPSKFGGVGFWSLNFFPVPLQNGEKGLGCIGVEITENKQTEKSLARERELFEGIFNNIPVMITIYDPELRNFRFNKELKNVTGWIEEDASDGNFMEKVYPNAEYRQKVVEFMKSLKSGWKEWEMTLKDGSVMASSWANIYLENGVQIGIGIDIRERKKIETILKSSEQRIRATFDNAAIGIVEVDSTDRFVAVNNRICEMLGYTREELLGKTVADITAPEDRNTSDFVNESIHRGDVKMHSYEKRYLKRDGTATWVNVTVSGIYDSNGRHINSIGTVEDISQKKKVEHALRESENRFRLLADNISQIAWISDKRGVPVWLNKRWYDYTGITLEEIRNGGHDLINHPSQTVQVFKNLQQSIAEGKPWEETYLMKNRAGEHRWFLSRSAPVFDEVGNISLWFGTSTDIHEQKIAQEDALARASEIEAILSSTPVGIVVYDTQGRVTRSNAASETVFPKKDFLNNIPDDFKAWTEDGRLLSPEELPPFRSAIKAETLTNEILYIENDSGLKWVIFNAAPLTIEGTHSGGVLSMMDITLRKGFEQKIQESEAQFRMLADNISQLTWVNNKDGEIIWYNQRWFDYTGKSVEDILREGYISVLHPDDAETVLESFYKSIHTESPWEYYFRLRGKNGEYRWFLGRAVPIRNEEGKIIKWFGTNTDVTEQRIVEENLRNSEQRLEAIFNNAAIGIVELDTENRFILVNQRVCEILGYSREELLEKTVTDVTAPPDREHSEYFYKKLQSGETNILSYEKRYIKKDGTYLWVHISISAIRDYNGKHLKSIGTVKDISDRKTTEARLKEVLRKAEEGKSILTALMEYVPLGIIIADAPDTRIRMVSRYGNNLIGKTNNETAGYTATDHPSKWGVYHLDGKTLAQSHELPLVRTITKGEYIKNEEWYVTAVDGRLVPVLCNTAPILNSEGNITGGIMGFQDITESRKIMEELRESERRYRLVLEAADLGTWDFDIETGVAVHSLRHDQIFGYQELQPEWSYETSVRHIFPEYHKTVRDAVARALETGILSYDAKIRWADGSIHWIGPRGRVQYNSEGKPVRMMGIVSDITDRKVAEEALRESEEKFRSLFENITEGVALYEMIYQNGQPVNYRIIDANPAYHQYAVSESKKDFVSADLYHSGESKYFAEFMQVAETRKPFKFETHSKSLNKHFIINVISPKQGQFATVLEDITEQKKTEQELKQKNEELTRFIYTVSHDLKSPLVTIKSFTSFLKEDIAENNTEAQNKDIAFIQNAVDKMGKLLDELLELSRIGRKEIQKTYTPLTDIAQGAIDLVAGRLSQKKIKIKFSGPPVMLYGHGQRLIQLYQNLIDNSAKFMGNQPDPEIEIGAFTHPENHEIVMFVRDNGSGIDPQYHHKLFGLFEKLDNSTEGTGIGLALIKRIVEVHGGTIWLDSEGAGKGTTFYFTLENTHLTE